jgi:hypothetical protein
MEWLAWTIGLITILLVALSIVSLFMRESLPLEARRSHVKRRRLSPSRWML